MSADNGVYILVTPRRDDPERFEYRVAVCQAIDNVCQQNAPWGVEQQQASAVVQFDCQTVYDNKDDAMIEALAIESDYGWTEYGICWVTPGFDGPFPDMRIDLARKALGCNE